MSKLRILQINKLYYPWIGGIESAAKAAAEGLADTAEMRVLVCSKKGRGSREKIGGAEIVRASSLGIYFSMPVSVTFPFLVRKYSRSADVVILHDPFPLGDLAVLLSGFKGKLIVWWHSDIVKQKKLLRLLRPVINALLKRADVIFAATERHIDSSPFISAFRSKCRVIPYGIDTDKYLKAPLRPILSGQAADSSRVKVLFAGRLVYYKGTDVLIRAFGEVEGAELFMAGTGKDEQELRILAEPLGNRVHFLGRLSDADLLSAFSDCDIFVLPSVEKSEAFGIVQLEAMIYAKPVINTALETGVPLVSLDGVTGITVPPRDEKALAAAIQKLVCDRSLRESYGENARKRVLEEFDVKKMCTDILNECKQ